MSKKNKQVSKKAPRKEKMSDTRRIDILFNKMVNVDGTLRMFLEGINRSEVVTNKTWNTLNVLIRFMQKELPNMTQEEFERKFSETGKEVFEESRKMVQEHLAAAAKAKAEGKEMPKSPALDEMGRASAALDKIVAESGAPFNTESGPSVPPAPVQEEATQNE